MLVRDTHTQTDRQTRLKIMALQVCNRAKNNKSNVTYFLGWRASVKGGASLPSGELRSDDLVGDFFWLTWCFELPSVLQRCQLSKSNRQFVQRFIMTHLYSTQVWHVLTRDHSVLPATHSFIREWKEPCLPLLPSRRAPPHFGWYSFPVQLRVAD